MLAQSCLGQQDIRIVLLCRKLSGGATRWSWWYLQQRTETWANTSTAVMVSYLLEPHLQGCTQHMSFFHNRNHKRLPVLHCCQQTAAGFSWNIPWWAVREMLGKRVYRDEQKRELKLFRMNTMFTPLALCVGVHVTLFHDAGMSISAELTLPCIRNLWFQTFKQVRSFFPQLWYWRLLLSCYYIMIFQP